MIKKAALGLLLGAAIAGPAFAMFGTKSGLEPGENVTPFHPRHISGPLANTTNCFPCTFQARPQVQVWVTNDDLKSVSTIASNLQKAMDANKAKEFKALVVLVAKNEAQADKLEAGIKEIVKETGAKSVGMAVIDEKDEALKAYKINPSAKNTVFAYREWKVKETLVDLKADDAGLKKLDGAIAKVLG